MAAINAVALEAMTIKVATAPPVDISSPVVIPRPENGPEVERHCIKAPRKRERHRHP